MNSEKSNTAKTTELAAFDLDGTLISEDSDYLWGQFLADSGYVDRREHEARNQEFFEAYKAGTLDIEAYSRFALAPLTRMSADERARLRQAFVNDCIKPVIGRGTAQLLSSHRKAGHVLLITTSTNRFVTEPIATLLGVDALLATDPELKDGEYTGDLADIPNFRANKVVRLKRWIAAQTQTFTHIHAWSDSHNDVALLEAADFPTAVDPDPRLRAVATERGWPVISLR